MSAIMSSFLIGLSSNLQISSSLNLTKFCIALVLTISRLGLKFITELLALD